MINTRVELPTIILAGINTMEVDTSTRRGSMKEQQPQWRHISDLPLFTNVGS